MQPWPVDPLWGLLLLLCSVGLVQGRCCEQKVVPGVSSKAGTYNLVSTSSKLPEFCLGGCVYTKEGDSQPGGNYCFKEGGGTTSCSGGGCGGGGNDQKVEGWIEKYFEKECSMSINSVLTVSVEKQYDWQSCGGGYDRRVENVSMELFENPGCEGIPTQQKIADGTGYYAQAIFLIKVVDTVPWSLFASKEGFKNSCIEIGQMIPFNQNRMWFYIEENNKESTIIPTGVAVNFTFQVNNELLTDVFVQGNPTSCRNHTFNNGPFKKSSKRKLNKKPKKSGPKELNKRKKKPNSDYDFFMKNPSKKTKQFPGSGSGSGGGGGGNNYKCSPTCLYTSWNTDPATTPCRCKGVIGGGLQFSNITLPNQQTPAGEAMMTGSLYGYSDTSITYGYPPKILLLFAEFTRRNNSSVRVCDSQLSINIASKLLVNVPCFEPQIPTTPPIPTYPIFPGISQGQSGITLPGFPPGMFSPSPTPVAISGYGSDSDFSSGYGSGNGDGSGYGSESSLPWPSTYPQWLTTTNHEDMFTEVDGDVLVYGKSDRFWILGCMLEPETIMRIAFPFFTSKDPRETPEFCGCLLSTMEMGTTITAAYKEQVKECYVKAIRGGPSPRTAQTMSRSGQRSKKGQKKRPRGDIQSKRVRKRMKKLEKLNRKQKKRQHLEKFVNTMRKKHNVIFNGRSKRDLNHQVQVDEEVNEYEYDVDEDDNDEDDEYDEYDDYDELSSDW